MALLKALCWALIFIIRIAVTVEVCGRGRREFGKAM